MKNRFLTLLFTLPFLASAQSEYDDQVFEVRCDSVAIARQQLQSMMLIREFILESGYNPVTKLMMSEFNTFGQPTYMEKSPHFNVDYDFYGLSYKIQQRFEYNQQHWLSNYCYNYKKRVFCQQSEYNESGNITRLTSGSDSLYTSEIQMLWEAGKMVKATFKNSDGPETSYRRTINEAGKIAEYSSDAYRITYAYSQTGNEETTTIHTYLKDTLYRVNIKKDRTDKKNLVTYYAEFNHKRDTLSAMMATYDTYGNVTNYEGRSYRYDMGEWGEEPYAPDMGEDSQSPFKQTPEKQNKPKTAVKPEIEVEKLELVNVYSDQNLLTKRLLYRISPKGERTLMAIDRVIYEKEPLISKPWYVEEENEYGDYGDE
ncbi:MAG: hypothetical protein V4604_17000 [Bacteroidota bacterium]